MDESLDHLGLSNDPSQGLGLNSSLLSYVVKPRSFGLIPEEEEYLFQDYACDLCGTQPIRNVRHHCWTCDDFDLCQDCFQSRRQEHWHTGFEEVDGRALLQSRERRVM